MNSDVAIPKRRGKEGKGKRGKEGRAKKDERIDDVKTPHYTKIHKQCQPRGKKDKRSQTGERASRYVLLSFSSLFFFSLFSSLFFFFFRRILIHYCESELPIALLIPNRLNPNATPFQPLKNEVRMNMESNYFGGIISRFLS